MDKFSSINGRPASALNCCGICALAVLANVSTNDVWNMYAKRFGKRSNWTGYTKLDELLVLAIADLKLKLVPVKHSNKYLASLLPWFKVRNEPYLVLTTGHMQVVCGDMYEDQFGLRHVDKAGRALNTIVKGVWSVERITTT